MEDKQQKQQYLYQEIIGANYDPNEFFTYITDQKQDGANLDLWSFEELVQIVDQFKQQNSHQYQEQQQNNNTENFNDQNTNTQSDENCLFNTENFQQEQEQQNDNQGNNNNNDNIQWDLQQKDQEEQDSNQNSPEEQKSGDQEKEGFEFLEDLSDQLHQKESMQEIYMKKHKISESFMTETLKCQKMNIGIPIHRKIKIIVTDPQKQVGYLFGLTGNYTLFKIITKPYDWEVQRRMTDFVSYRNVLQKLFPGKLIPPLDPNNKEHNDTEIQKRMKFLNNFVNDLRHSSCIWYHPYTVSFFSDSKEQWEKTLKQAEKEKQSERIRCNISGEIPIRFSNENYEYKEELEGYMNQSEIHYNKLYMISKQLQDDFKNLSNTLKQMSDIYYNIFTDINGFNGKIVEGQVHHKKLGDSYYIQGQIFDNWSQYMSKSITEIQNITNQFKYSFNEVKVQKELYKSCQESENIFIKYQQIYHEKLSQDYTNSDDAEIQYYSQLKSEYAYWLTQTCQESQRMYSKKGDDNIKFLNYIAQTESSKINDFVKAWQDVTQAYIKSPFPIPREAVKIKEKIDI